MKLRILPLALPAFLLLGCAAVDPAPYQDFARTTRELGAAADAAFSLPLAFSEARLREAAIGDQGQAFALQLAFEGDGPIPWRAVGADGREPFLHTLRRFRGGFAQLNGVLADYGEALSALAGTSVEGDQLDAWASDLNGALTDATGALGQAPPANDLALVSTAAAGILQMTVRAKQREALAQTLEANHGWVDEVGEAGQRGCVLLSQALVLEYQNAVAANLGTLFDIPTEPSRDEPRIEETRAVEVPAGRERVDPREVEAAARPTNRERRGRTVDDQLDLNATVTATLEGLQVLHESYGRLGDLHEELARQLEDGDSPQSLLNSMKSDVANLERLFGEFTPAEERGAPGRRAPASRGGRDDGRTGDRR